MLLLMTKSNPAAGKRSLSHSTDSESPWGDVTLPCPEPLDEAVEVGFFGELEDGDLRPTPEHVASLTSEHALELLNTLLDKLHLASCLKKDAHPATGRPLTGYKHAAAMREQLATEVARLADHYVACLDVYETAFGTEATEQLKACVEQVAETYLAASVPRQRTLF